MERGRSVRIEVTDELGHPLPGAKVRTQPSYRSEWKQLLTAPTLTAVSLSPWLQGSRHPSDINGLITVSNVPTFPLRIEASCEGYLTNTFGLSTNQTNATVVMRAEAP